VCDPGSDPPETGEPLGTRRSVRHRLCLASRRHQALSGIVQRTDDLVELAFPGTGNLRHPLRAGGGEDRLDAAHMPPPDEQRAAEPQGHQDQQSGQHAEPEQ
jgi:hypothetical protein